MKQDKFENLVRSSLESIEPEVPAHLWENIRGQIPAPQVSGSGSGNQAAPSSGAGSGAASLFKIGAAAIVLIGGGLIVWQLNSGKTNETSLAVEEQAQVLSESEQNREESVVSPQEEASPEVKTAENSSNPVAKSTPEKSGTEELYAGSEEVAETAERVQESAPGEDVQTDRQQSITDEADIPQAEEVAEENRAFEKTNTGKSGATAGTDKSTSEDFNAEEVEAETGESGTEDETFELVEAGVLASDVKGEAPLEVTFSNVSDAVGYEWNFGNGQFSSKPSPDVVFDEPGDYTVRLTVTDNQGRRMTDLIEVSVYGLFIPNIFTPNGDGINDTFIVKGSNLTSISYRVYRIDGSLVFEGHSSNAEWDGTDVREPQAENYQVIAVASLQDGSEVVKKQLLTVRRN